MNERVTARIVRTEDGRQFTEYQIGNVVVGSIAELQAVTEDR